MEPMTKVLCHLVVSLALDLPAMAQDVPSEVTLITLWRVTQSSPRRRV